MKRKKRRMKLKAKGNNESIIEKFCAQSSKTAKYAKSVVKKRENSELRQTEKSEGMNGNPTVLINGISVTSSNDNNGGTNNSTAPSTQNN